MAISAIVIRGYGSWAAVTDLPTFGYSSSPSLTPIFESALFEESSIFDPDQIEDDSED